MKIKLIRALIIIVSLNVLTFAVSAQTVIERMPRDLETRFALSALPSPMRSQASVFLLDPGKGYQLYRQGSSGVTCLVERTAWERADFRNDIYVPLCYDFEGSKTYLKVIMDAASLRAQGLTPAALKAEIEKRYRRRIYRAPQKAGLSYMIAPLMRTWMPNGEVHAMQIPHLMFYAPYLQDKDIGAAADSNHMYPFIIEEGLPAQSYLIQPIGEAEAQRIIADEHNLLDDLCSYREILCLHSKNSDSRAMVSLKPKKLALAETISTDIFKDNR